MAVSISEDEGVTVSSFKQMLSFSWADIHELAVEGTEQASSRVTVTRLALVG